VLNTLVAAAPLAGLLGTVMGMLAMFSGLSHGKGQAGMQKVAAGMQEALITTQTGLTIALPGLFIALIIKSKRDRIEAASSASKAHPQRPLPTRTPLILPPDPPCSAAASPTNPMNPSPSTSRR
jgi:hypothetical protein